VSRRTRWNYQRGTGRPHDPGKRRRRARTSHVSSRSTACSRQVRARAPLEEAAMGTLHCVQICVNVFALGAEFLAAMAASNTQEHLGPWHLAQTAEGSLQSSTYIVRPQPSVRLGGASRQVN